MRRAKKSRQTGTPPLAPGLSASRQQSIPDDAKPLGGLTVGELRTLLGGFVATLLAQARTDALANTGAISLRKASQLAHRHPAVLRGAIHSGALMAHRAGKRRYSIPLSALNEWIAAGFPLERK